MKDGFLIVGALIPNARVADPAANARELAALAAKAAEAGVSVLATPELALTTATAGDLCLSSCLASSVEEALRVYLDETAELDLLSFVGLPVALDGKLYNAAAVAFRGRLIGLVPKSVVGGRFAPAPAENRVVSYAGYTCLFGARQLFTCAGAPRISVACEIGDDLLSPVPPSVFHAAAGATLIVDLAADPETVGRATFRRDLVRLHSSRIRAAYVYAGAGKGESGTDLVFSGHGMIASAGRMVAEAEPFSDVPVLSGTVDLDLVLSERLRVPGATPDAPLYDKVEFDLQKTSVPTPAVPRLPFVPEDQAELKRRCDLILSIQSRALAGRMERAHANSAVVGVSGGLDSTLALLVAVFAADLSGLPRTAVHAVTMPGFGTTGRTRGNAEKLAEALGATLSVVEIKKAVEQHFSDIGHDPKNTNAVYENAQARERTQVLMDLANGEGGLVVGTGDLSELALGWATYNGDHMSMYGVNAGVPKTLMRHLVACVADGYAAKGETAVAKVLRDVLDTPVSPELLPPENGEIAQKTEGIVGPYELHDFFLWYAVRCGFAPGKILRLAARAFAPDYSLDEIYEWEKTFFRRFFSQQFKRSCMADGPAIGSLSLSPRCGFAMPSDAGSGAWIADLDRRYAELGGR